MQRFALPIGRWTNAKIALLHKKCKLSALAVICLCVYLTQRLLPLLFPLPADNYQMKPISRDVIIYASFIYTNSTSFALAGPPAAPASVGQQPLDTVVVLMHADHTDQFPNARCARSIQQTENGSTSGEETVPLLQVVVPKLSRYDYTGLCQLALFIAFCHFPPAVNGTFAMPHDADSPMIDMGIQVLADKQLHQFRDTLYHKGFQPPFLESMNFDPAKQVEYSGQLAIAHECFYEFRESAAFIAMLDLDDLLISTKFPTLIDALNAALIAYPMAPYFYVNKRESGILLTQRPNRKGGQMSNNNNNNNNNSSILDDGGDVVKHFREMIFTKNWYNSEKIVLRPNRIEAFWVHFSRHFWGEGQPAQLPTDHLLILHLSNEIKATDDANEYTEKLLTKMNWTTAGGEAPLMDSNYSTSSSNSLIQKMVSKMPKKLHYFDAIRRCSRFINSYPTVPVHLIPPCLSYKLCPLPMPKVKCTVTKSEYKMTQIEPTKLYRVHVLQRSYFVEKDGCF